MHGSYAAFQYCRLWYLNSCIFTSLLPFKVTEKISELMQYIKLIDIFNEKVFGIIHIFSNTIAIIDTKIF